MAVVRIVTDIRVKDMPDVDVINKLSKSMVEYANGVLVEVSLTGEESVLSGASHVHAADDHACGVCRDMGVDHIY